MYLTHGVGPVMQWLSINRSNRFLTIRSTASKSRSWEKYISEHDVADKSLKGRRFNMGDVVMQANPRGRNWTRMGRAREGKQYGYRYFS